MEAYFRRIGYTGSREPTLDTLSGIHLLHPQAIPFENLNPLLRLPVRLDIASIQQKLVQGGRGGYCFEQNLLLKQVLEALGFEVRGLAARVVWNMPEGSPLPARGHMVLLIELDDQYYIADVGFGVMTLTAPLLLEPGIVQETPHEPFRLVVAGEDFLLQTRIRGEWKAMYRFGLQEQLLSDYEVTNWYLSNHPDSHFVTGLMAARVTTGSRHTLSNNELTEHHLKGGTERRVLGSVAELKSVLSGTFGLSLPEAPGMDQRLQKLISGMSKTG